MATGSGSDSFATATPFDFGDTAAPTPSGVLTTEVGEPDLSGGTYTRSAWWTFTAPATATVGLDLLQTVMDPARDVFDYDTVIHVYTGASLDALTLVADGDDNDRLDNPAGESVYGYLTEMDFEAVGGTTYWVRVASFDYAPDMDYVLRLGARMFLYGPWVARPDVVVPLEMYNLDNWDENLPVSLGMYKSFTTSYITPFPGEPDGVGEDAVIDTVVAQVAAATDIDNVDLPDHGYGAGLHNVNVFMASEAINDRIINVGGLFIHVNDWETFALGTVHAYVFRPKHYGGTHNILFAIAEELPYDDPEAVDIQLATLAPPTIDSTFVLDQLEAYWDPTSGTSYPITVTGGTNFEVCVAPFDVNNIATWDLATTEVIAHYDFTEATEIIKRETADTPVLNALLPDGSFVFVARVTTVGDLATVYGGPGDPSWGSRVLDTGPTWNSNFRVNQGVTDDYWFGYEAAPMSVQYLVKGLSPWRYMYPTVTDGAYFIAKPDLTWEPMMLSIALAEPATWSAQPTLQLLE